MRWIKIKQKWKRLKHKVSPVRKRPILFPFKSDFCMLASSAVMCLHAFVNLVHHTFIKGHFWLENSQGHRWITLIEGCMQASPEMAFSPQSFYEWMKEIFFKWSYTREVQLMSLIIFSADMATTTGVTDHECFNGKSSHQWPRAIKGLHRTCWLVSHWFGPSSSRLRFQW